MVSEVWETSHLFIFAVFVEQIADRILSGITVSVTEIIVKVFSSPTACTPSSIMAQLLAQLTHSNWLSCNNLCLNLSPQKLQV